MRVEEVVERLGGEGLRRRLRTTKPMAQRYPISVARLQGLVESLEATDLQEAMRELIDKAALSRSDGADTATGRVNLLTLHATKGLEFSRVYIVGVEDAELPGLREISDRMTDAMAEARRVLYVGMTRAEDRLVMTRVTLRGGRPTGGNLFLSEMGIAAEIPTLP
jgi:superfamily I DNA/RNA helicase